MLNCAARVRVVSASPGSGKTWLVAEAIKQELKGWEKAGGIAALSFTNVARDEISGALGCVPGSPHFVGTIDSFVYRHILRPFSHFIGLPILRLISPESARSFSSQFPPVLVGKARVNIFEVTFLGEEGAKLVLSARTRFQGQVTLSDKDAKLAFEQKKELWIKRKCLSTADAIWLATRILRHEKHGAFIRRTLASRFPFLIVDELQDTGWFLGVAIRALLSDEAVRGLLVGDPDQAIYAFNGARPDLFNEFLKLPGAKRHEIPYTRRCSDPICLTAKHLRQSGSELTRQASLAGRSTLLVYDNAEADLELVRQALSVAPFPGKSAIVTRRNVDVAALLKISSPTPPDFGPVPIKFLHGAVNRLLLGEMAPALALAKGALTYAVCKDANPADDELVALGIDLRQLRTEAIGLLISASKEVGGEDLLTWGTRMKGLLEATCARNGWIDSKSKGAVKIKSPFAKLAGVDRKPLLAKDGPPSRTEIQTVHAVKGETHEVTVLYAPDPKSPESCPSKLWWSADLQDQEERRIAYVAATRPRTEFVLAVSAGTKDRLAELQPAFFRSFQVESTAEHLARLERQRTAAP